MRRKVEMIIKLLFLKAGQWKILKKLITLMHPLTSSAAICHIKNLQSLKTRGDNLNSLKKSSQNLMCPNTLLFVLHRFSMVKFLQVKYESHRCSSTFNNYVFIKSLLQRNKFAHNRYDKTPS